MTGEDNKTSKNKENLTKKTKFPSEMEVKERHSERLLLEISGTINIYKHRNDRQSKYVTDY